MNFTKQQFKWVAQFFIVSVFGAIVLFVVQLESFLFSWFFADRIPLWFVFYPIVGIILGIFLVPLFGVLLEVRRI